MVNYPGSPGPGIGQSNTTQVALDPALDLIPTTDPQGEPVLMIQPYDPPNQDGSDASATSLGPQVQEVSGPDVDHFEDVSSHLPSPAVSHDSGPSTTENYQHQSEIQTQRLHAEVHKDITGSVTAHPIVADLDLTNIPEHEDVSEDIVQDSPPQALTSLRALRGLS